MEQNTPGPAKAWTDNIVIKVITIGFLIMALMIPSLMINELVRERSSRKMEVTNEVSSKWGQLQTITGPYVVIPYLEEIKYTDRSSEWREQKLFYFPQSMEIAGDLTPVVKKRSIFKVMLYESEINIRGSFSYPDLAALKIAPDKVMWDKASLYLSITDLSGVGARVNLQLGDKLIPMTAAVPAALQLPSGLMCNLPDSVAGNEKMDFAIQLSLKGSQGIYFSPVANHNKVKITSSWPSQNLKGNSCRIRALFQHQVLKPLGRY